MSRILSVGEALIDVVNFPRGRRARRRSLLNVRNGIAQLGTAAASVRGGAVTHRELIAASIASTGAEVEPGTDSAPTTSVAQATWTPRDRHVHVRPRLDCRRYETRTASPTYTPAASVPRSNRRRQGCRPGDEAP